MVALNPRLSVTHNGHNTWKLHISDVQLNDSGSYMCQGKNIVPFPSGLRFSVPLRSNGIRETLAALLSLRTQSACTLVVPRTRYRINWHKLNNAERPISLHFPLSVPIFPLLLLRIKFEYMQIALSFHAIHVLPFFSFLSLRISGAHTHAVNTDPMRNQVSRLLPPRVRTMESVEQANGRWTDA